MLYRWPPSAAVGRVIPKERLYTEAGAGSLLKRRFVEQVQQVRWAYKLGLESVRLRGDEGVPEIQVFEIELKGAEVSESILTAIDKSVPSPIIFELHRSAAAQAEVQLAAARKELGVRGQKLSSYIKGEWVSSDCERSPLPPALDLEGLYSQLLVALLPLPARPGEELSGAIDRMDGVRKLEREIGALEKCVRLERQFNRKVELRREVRARQAELDAITNEKRTDC